MQVAPGRKIWIVTYVTKTTKPAVKGLTSEVNCTIVAINCF